MAKSILYYHNLLYLAIYILYHVIDTWYLLLIPMQPIQNRIYSIDLLRGLVMIIMALDHTRDFIHFDSFVHDPTNLETTSIALFFTRWITHYSAPVFVFLSGISIFLQSLRKSRSELSKFLFKRGLWLILIELLVINFAWTFDVFYSIFVLQVIWAIGISMVLMGFIIRLPFKIILGLGLLIVCGHNILDNIESTHQGFFWDITRNGNFAFYPIGTRNLIIIYPFVPWFGLMMLGYCLGRVYEPAYGDMKRRKLLLNSGIGIIVFFILLRFLNLYGNPNPWTTQKNGVFTLLSFINLQKYPPSLLFLCMTIGPALIFLALFEKINTRFTRAISVYGKVPFFYYILHFYILHLLAMVFFLYRGHSFSEPSPPGPMSFRFVIPTEGYSLTIVYIVWILMVLALYPLCLWFSRYKKEKRYWWLSYL